MQLRSKIIKEKIWFLPAFPRGREPDHELKQHGPGMLAAPPVPAPLLGAGTAAGSGALDTSPCSCFPTAGSMRRQFCSGYVSCG